MATVREILELGIVSGEHHIAPALSCKDILRAVYDFKTDNDKFILSKGHGCLALYCELRNRGFNPTIRGHPDIEPEQGVVCTTGSLGHGLPIGVGMALAKKILNNPGKVYVLVGDGECQQGSVWESMFIASNNYLNNLVIIVDNNGLQATSKLIGVTSLFEKFRSFGAYVTRCNGHDIKELTRWLKLELIDKPMVIIAETIKGKGISFMEHNVEWHNKVPKEELLTKARVEVENNG